MFNWIKKLLGKDDNKVALSSNIEVVTEDEKLHSLEVEIKQKLYEKLGIECKTVFVAKNYNLISLFLPYCNIFDLNGFQNMIEILEMSNIDIFVIYNAEYKPEYEIESKTFYETVRIIGVKFVCVNVSVDEIYFEYDNCYQHKIENITNKLNERLNSKYEIKPSIITNTTYFTRNFNELSGMLSSLIKQFNCDDNTLDWYFDFYSDLVIFEVKSLNLKHNYTPVTQFLSP
jgi:hypothetical protein